MATVFITGASAAVPASTVEPPKPLSVKGLDGEDLPFKDYVELKNVHRHADLPFDVNAWKSEHVTLWLEKDQGNLTELVSHFRDQGFEGRDLLLLPISDVEKIVTKAGVTEERRGLLLRRLIAGLNELRQRQLFVGIELQKDAVLKAKEHKRLELIKAADARQAQLSEKPLGREMAKWTAAEVIVWLRMEANRRDCEKFVPILADKECNGAELQSFENPRALSNVVKGIHSIDTLDQDRFRAAITAYNKARKEEDDKADAEDHKRIAQKRIEYQSSLRVVDELDIEETETDSRSSGSGAFADVCQVQLKRRAGALLAKKALKLSTEETMSGGLVTASHSVAQEAHIKALEREAVALKMASQLPHRIAEFRGVNFSADRPFLLMTWCQNGSLEKVLQTAAKHDEKSLQRRGGAGAEPGDKVSREDYDNVFRDDHQANSVFQNKPWKCAGAGNAWPNQVRVVMEVAEAVRFLHTKCAMVHGDIAARNVVLDDKWHAYLTDFGQARYKDDLNESKREEQKRKDESAALETLYQNEHVANTVRAQVKLSSGKPGQAAPAPAANLSKEQAQYVGTLVRLAKNIKQSTTSIFPREYGRQTLEQKQEQFFDDDVYNFGVFMWQVATKCRKEPFAGSDAIQIITARYMGSPLIPSEEDIPSEFYGFIKACCEPVRDRSKAITMKDLLEKLKAYHRKLVIAEDVTDGAPGSAHSEYGALQYVSSVLAELNTELEEECKNDTPPANFNLYKSTLKPLSNQDALKVVERDLASESQVLTAIDRAFKQKDYKSLVYALDLFQDPKLLIAVIKTLKDLDNDLHSGADADWCLIAKYMIRRLQLVMENAQVYRVGLDALELLLRGQNTEDPRYARFEVNFVSLLVDGLSIHLPQAQALMKANNLEEAQAYSQLFAAAAKIIPTAMRLSDRVAVKLVESKVPSLLVNILLCVRSAFPACAIATFDALRFFKISDVDASFIDLCFQHALTFASKDGNVEPDSSSIFAPQPRSYQACEGCGTQFSMFGKPVNCRHCGGCFCQACSARTIPLPKFGFNAAVNVCEPCYRLVANENKAAGASALSPRPQSAGANPPTDTPTDGPAPPVSALASPRPLASDANRGVAAQAVPQMPPSLPAIDNPRMTLGLFTCVCTLAGGHIDGIRSVFRALAGMCDLEVDVREKAGEPLDTLVRVLGRVSRHNVALCFSLLRSYEVGKVHSAVTSLLKHISSPAVDPSGNVARWMMEMGAAETVFIRSMETFREESEVQTGCCATLGNIATSPKLRRQLEESPASDLLLRVLIDFPRAAAVNIAALKAIAKMSSGNYKHQEHFIRGNILQQLQTVYKSFLSIDVREQYVAALVALTSGFHEVPKTAKEREIQALNETCRLILVGEQLKDVVHIATRYGAFVSRGAVVENMFRMLHQLAKVSPRNFGQYVHALPHLLPETAAMLKVQAIAHEAKMGFNWMHPVIKQSEELSPSNSMAPAVVRLMLIHRDNIAVQSFGLRLLERLARPEWAEREPQGKFVHPIYVYTSAQTDRDRWRLRLINAGGLDMVLLNLRTHASNPKDITLPDNAECAMRSLSILSELLSEKSQPVTQDDPRDKKVKFEFSKTAQEAAGRIGVEGGIMFAIKILQHPSYAENVGVIFHVLKFLSMMGMHRKFSSQVARLRELKKTLPDQVQKLLSNKMLAAHFARFNLVVALEKITKQIKFNDI